MRVPVVWLCGLCLPVWSLVATAQAIHKCEAAEGTAYQSAPCGNGASDIVIASAGAESRLSSRRIVEPPSMPPRRAADSGNRRVFWRTSIAIGMTDDEVLNLASWGRPSAITRTRSNRVWHEEWLYRWRTGGTSRLSFANGKLTAVDAGAGESDAPTPVSLTLR